jgi:PKD repeat protein
MLILLLFSVTIQAATINVTDHGATPNDGSNDISAIQDAIQQAGAGDIVSFPEGTFIIDRAISPKSGIVVSGAGEGTVIQSNAGSYHVMIGLSGVSDVEITALTLDGNGNSRVSQGISASNGSGLYIHHMTIKNLVQSSGLGPHGIYFTSNVTDSRIEDNTIDNIATNHEWGAGMRISTNSARNLILRNTISRTGRGGILCDRNSTDLIIRENNISGSGGTGLGIEVWGGCPRALIEDNVIDHWLSVDASSESAIRRNTISEKSGIYKGHGLELVSASNCIFTDNVLDDGTAIGISISNDGPKEYVYWGYNTIENSNTWGVQVQGDAGGASYQYFYKNKFINTYQDHPEAWYANQGHGFRMNGNCHYITLDNNEIIDNGGAGIQFSGSDINHLSFINNTITGNTGTSVTSDPGSALEWENNTVTDNGTNTQLTTRGFNNQKPTASFDCDDRVLVNEEVQFTNTSTDPDGSIGHVLWDFGDGLPSNETSPSYTYEKIGTYRVSLLVWDDEGRGAIAEKNVAVVTSLGTGGGDDRHKRYKPFPVQKANVRLEAVRKSGNEIAVSYTLITDAYIRITINDPEGREMAVLADDRVQAGMHQNLWNAKKSTGVFLCRLTSGTETAYKKILILR